MTVDVVCAGPVFLDLTFEGLEEPPDPGRERFARELHETPGGAAITAVGLARLGLRAAVAGALGRDVAGRTLRRLLEADGVTCADAEAERTPVTVVLPMGNRLGALLLTVTPWAASRIRIIQKPIRTHGEPPKASRLAAEHHKQKRKGCPTGGHLWSKLVDAESRKIHRRGKG